MRSVVVERAFLVARPGIGPGDQKRRRDVALAIAGPLAQFAARRRKLLCLDRPDPLGEMGEAVLRVLLQETVGEAEGIRHIAVRRARRRKRVRAVRDCADRCAALRGRRWRQRPCHDRRRRRGRRGNCRPDWRRRRRAWRRQCSCGRQRPASEAEERPRRGRPRRAKSCECGAIATRGPSFSDFLVGRHDLMMRHDRGTAPTHAKRFAPEHGRFTPSRQEAVRLPLAKAAARRQGFPELTATARRRAPRQG